LTVILLKKLDKLNVPFIPCKELIHFSLIVRYLKIFFLTIQLWFPYIALNRMRNDCFHQFEKCEEP